MTSLVNGGGGGGADCEELLHETGKITLHCK